MVDTGKKQVPTQKDKNVDIGKKQVQSKKTLV